MADKSIIKYENIIGADDTFDVIEAKLNDLEAQILELAKKTKGKLKLVNPNETKVIQELVKSVTQLEQSEKALNKQRQITTSAKKKLKDLTDAELVQREREKIANRERVQIAKQQAILTSKQSGEIEKLRARLSLVTLQWKKLTKEELENTNKGRNLVKQKLALTNQLKKLEKQTGDTRRNVGNYTDSLGKLGKLTARIFIGRSVFDGLRRIGSAFSNLIEQNKDTDKSIGDLDKALGQFGKSAGGLGLSILRLVSGPLTAFLNGLKTVFDFLSGASNEAESFSATSEELEGVIKNLNTEFAKEQAQLNQVFTQLAKTNEGSKERKALIDQINDQYGKYLPNLLTEKSTLQEIEAAQRLVNDALTQGFLLRVQQATQTDIFNKKSKETIKAFEDIVKESERVGKAIGFDQLGAFQKLTTELSRNNQLAGEAAAVFFDDAKASDLLKGALDGLGTGVKDLFFSLVNADRAGGDVLSTFRDLVRSTANYDEAIQDTQKSINSIQDGLKTYDRTVTTNTKNTKENTKALIDNAEARIKATKELQKDIQDLEAENLGESIEADKARERLRFKRAVEARKNQLKEFEKLIQEEQKSLLEVEGKESEKFKEFKKKTDAELIEFEKLTNEAIEKERAKSLRIRQGLEDAAAKERLEKEKKQTEKRVNTISGAIGKLSSTISKNAAKTFRTAGKEASEEIEERTKELLGRIEDTTKQIGNKINELFTKQVERTKQAVQEQQAALDNARERDRLGLTANLKFEQEELARREAEQIRAEKRAQQAAKLTAIFNIIAAAAAKGDANAAFTGIAQIGILEGIEALLGGGFIEGTEHVEDALGGSNKFFNKAVDNYLGITKSGKLFAFDGQERIFNPMQNAALGGMSNDDAVNYALLGQHVSDILERPMLDIAHYKKQTHDFAKATANSDNSKFNRLENEMREVRRAIKTQPNYAAEIERLEERYYILLKKYTKGNMTKVKREKKRL